MSSGQPRILIVEDDRITRECLAVVLREEGYEVDVANDGEEALAFCQTVTPDLVMTDLNMPKLGGEEFIERVRWQHPDIRVAVITGEVPFDAGRRAVALGAKHYFSKPIELDDMLVRVRQMVGQGSSQGQSQGSGRQMVAARLKKVQGSSG